MALEGDLAVIGLSDIFQTLAASQKAGTLVVENSESRKSIYFQEGMVWVISEGVRRTIKLGEALIAQNKITPAQLASALEQQEVTKERLGEILQSMGLVTENDVEQVIRGQLEEDIFDVFTWKAGKFKFLEETIPEGFDQTEDVMNLNVQSIVMEAARRTDELDVIREYIPSEDVVLRVKDGADCEKYDDTFKELIIGLLDGRNTVSDLAERLGGHRFELKGALAELVQDEVVEPIPTEAMVELGIGAMEEGNPERASRLLAVAVAGDPTDVGNFLLLAEAYESINDKRRAGQTYKTGATAAAEAGEVEHAVDFLARARRLLPNDLEVNEQVLELLSAFADHIQDADSRFMEEGKALVKAYRREKRFPDAIRLCRRLLQEDPEDIDVHKILVNIFLDQKDDEEALAEYDVLAQLLTKKKDWDELQGVLEKIAKLDPSRTSEINRRLDQIQVTGAERRRRSMRRMLKLVMIVVVGLLGFGMYLLHQNAVSRWDEFENELRANYVSKKAWSDARDAIDEWVNQHGALKTLIGSRISDLRKEVLEGAARDTQRRETATETIAKKCSAREQEGAAAEKELEFGKARSLKQEALACYQEQVEGDFELFERHRIAMEALTTQIARLSEVLGSLDGARATFLSEVEKGRKKAPTDPAGAAVILHEATEALSQHGFKTLKQVSADPDESWAERRINDLGDFSNIEFPVLIHTSNRPRHLRYRLYESPTPGQIASNEDPWLKGAEATTPVVVTIPYRREIVLEFHPPEKGVRLLPVGANVENKHGIMSLLTFDESRALRFYLKSRPGRGNEQTGILVSVSDLDLRSVGGSTGTTSEVYSSTSTTLFFEEFRTAVLVPDTDKEVCTGPPSVIDNTVIFPANNLLYRIDASGQLVGTCNLSERARELGFPSVRTPVVAIGGGPMFAVDHKGSVVEIDRSSFKITNVHTPEQPRTGNYLVEGNLNIAGSCIVYDTQSPTIISFDTSSKTFTYWHMKAYKADALPSASAVLMGDVLYIPTTKNVIAIPCSNGRLNPTAAASEVSPPVGELAGALSAGQGVFYGVNLDRSAPTFFAFDAANKSLERVEIGLQPPPPADPIRGRISNVAVGAAAVIVGSVDGKLYGFAPWSGHGKALQALPWSPRLLDTHRPIEATPRIIDGRFYVPTVNSGLFVIDQANGRTIWRSVIYEGDPGTDDRGRIGQQIAILGSRIYLATGESIYTIEAGSR